MDVLEKIIGLFRNFFESHGKEILRNSPVLRWLYKFLRLVKRKMQGLLIKRFLPAALTLLAFSICAVIFLPHLFFSDRCYLMSVTNVTIRNTTASRPCVHGALLAFTTDGGKHVYFSAEITSEDPVHGRWYQNDNDSKSSYPDYINFRYDVEDKEYLIDVDLGECRIATPGESKTPRAHFTGIRLITTEPRPGPNATPSRYFCNSVPADNPTYKSCDWIKYEIAIPNVMPTHICKPHSWLDFWSGDKKIKLMETRYICGRAVRSDINTKNIEPLSDWEPWGAIESVWCD